MMEPYELVFAIVTAMIVGIGAWLEWRRMAHAEQHESRARTESGAETQARLARLEAAQEHVERLTRLEVQYDQLTKRIEESDLLTQLVAEAESEPEPPRSARRTRAKS